MPRGKSVMSITELEKMLNDRRSDLAKLQEQRAVASRKLEELDAQIRKLGGGEGSSSSSSSSSSSNGSTGSTGASATKGTRRGGRRAKNTMSLVEALESVLTGKEPMKVADIVSGVEAAGYKSSSANFRGIVNQTLIKDKKFASPSRGLYQMK